MGLRAALSKYLFTAFFICWELGKRLRGKWRRSRLREWWRAHAPERKRG
ncbi:hypothetical protein [Alicycliphilus denitrificans]|nr:hypothetical protein [Alicycliphilus denitrificans]ADU99034.1 hypothetical protein Alide_1273 [Alicycliphilus denitrificans BC]